MSKVYRIEKRYEVYDNGKVEVSFCVLIKLRDGWNTVHQVNTYEEAESYIKNIYQIRSYFETLEDNLRNEGEE